MFADEAGAPASPDRVRWALQRVLAQAGLPRIRFHDLRHAAATLLLSCGVHPRIVSEMLGHSTIAITLDLYSQTVRPRNARPHGRWAWRCLDDGDGTAPRIRIKVGIKRS
ncbi:MAG TPA: tyrosine-type recombinase/integrase, partial [Candidatus Limnocylindria bacterium]|nr:tyrosine-type recombinase/integrase [Candidatus Limnocylindria bacterium]